MRLLFTILLLCTVFTTHAQVLKDPQEAFALSQRSGKPVLLVFSGSDWCIPCIQFNKKILSDSSFLQFAHNKVILLEADFPQRKKITPSLKKQYDALADKYDPQGNFPQIVLLSTAKEHVAHFVFLSQTAADFISELKQKLD